MRKWPNMGSIKYLILTLLILHLIPIWTSKFIPTQDGLNHIYNAYILKDYNNPEYTKLREVYYLNARPYPNWGAHAFFYLAIHVIPPLIADKLFVSLCITLLPLSLFYFLKQIDKSLIFFGFLGFLYSYNGFVNLGFYGFALSFSIYFFSLGYWWKFRHNMRIKQAAILNLLIAATYLSHFFSYAMLLLSISLLALTSALLPGDEQRTTRERIKSLAGSIATMIPSYLVLLYLLAANPEKRAIERRSISWLWDYFMSVESLLSFNDKSIPLMWCLLGFVAFCFFWKIIRDKFIDKKLIDQQDGFFFLFLISTLLFFILPWKIGSPSWINGRMNLFLFPVLLAWFSYKYPKWLKYTLISVMILLSLLHLIKINRDYQHLNKDMAEFTSGAHLIKPNSIVAIIGNHSLDTEHSGNLKYMSPFYHDTCYYCLGNGSHYVGNYEPKYFYFPIRYRYGYWKYVYNGIIDYMLVWRRDENDREVQQVTRDYELIHETKNLKLFHYSGKTFSRLQEFQKCKVGYIMGDMEKEHISTKALRIAGIQYEVIGGDDYSLERLSEYGVIGIGACAYEKNEDLRANVKLVNDYVMNGGYLVTLDYQEDATWESDFLPYPLRLFDDDLNDEKGVELMEHPIWKTPHKITEEHFIGWGENNFASDSPHEIDPPWMPLLISNGWPIVTGAKVGDGYIAFSSLQTLKAIENTGDDSIIEVLQNILFWRDDTNQ